MTGRRWPAAALLCTLAAVQAAAPPTKWGMWPKWGDQADGTYRNPVLPADFSDLDCIRVGEDYYAISSTMQFSPGMVILHSRDLVNWEILGHAASDLTQIGPDLNWSAMNRYGRGIWAGSIRHHDGKFRIYFGTPDEGLFLTTATNPAGPWEPLQRVLDGPGWDDPCPFWDDDGQGYLVATSFRDGYKIHLWKLTPDGRAVVPESDQVIHQSKGSEANKLYKIDGFYYHLFSDVHAEGRVVMMERSRSIRSMQGPYTEIRQLNHADRAAMEPNQGGLVQTTSGAWYWFTHHGTGDWEGRAASLVPVTWRDGWPILGEPDEQGIGHFVWSGEKPLTGGAVVTPHTDDEFAETQLAPQWEWNYQPRADMWSLTERSGWLRLHAFRPVEPGDLKKAGNTLTQRSFRTADNEVEVKFDLRGMADGQSAGLCHFSKDASALAVVQTGSVRRLEYQHGAASVHGPRLRGRYLWLKSRWGLDGASQYSFSRDGRTFTQLGKPYQLSWGHYRGDRIGIFSYNDRADAGHADIDYFHYRYGAPAVDRGRASGRSAGRHGTAPAPSASKTSVSFGPAAPRK